MTRRIVFTFLATTNERSELARRGRSKQKRDDLRQIGLALLVTREFQVPLFHRLYPGNVPDVTLFPRPAGELVERYRNALGSPGETTLVFDKGNVSDDAMEELAVRGAHFVAALAGNRCADLLSTASEKLQPLRGLPGTKAFQTARVFWAKSCSAVVVYTESFFTQQLAGVTNDLVKSQKKLLDLAKGLERWRRGKGRGRKPTLAAVRRSVRNILSAQFMKELIRAQVRADEKSAIPSLRYEVDHAALERLSRERLGRTVLVTDHLEWSARRVVETYRSLTWIEEAFKNMKNTDFLPLRPPYHWSDQKLRVHAFYCVLALLLASLARKVAHEARIDLSLPALLKELAAIREVAVIYPPGTLARRNDHITLSAA